MPTSIISPPTVDELRAVLEPLPPPSYIEVALNGKWDLSHLSGQASVLIPGLYLELNDGAVYRIEDPSIEKAIDIYRSSEDILASITRRETRGNPPRMDLHKVGWILGSGNPRLDDVVRMELTPVPAEVNVSYHNQEPEYVTALRQAVVRNRFKLTTTQGK